MSYRTGKARKVRRRRQLKMTAAQVASVCQVQPEYVTEWIMDGFLLAERIGRQRYLISSETLRKFMRGFRMDESRLNRFVVEERERRRGRMGLHEGLDP